MKGVVALPEATDPAVFGGKAAQLGAALRAGLPVPPGYALSWETVAEISAGALIEEFAGLFNGSLLAVRSSAVGEDSAVASFAGTHESVLGVPAHELAGAVRAVGASAATAAAAAYRDRLGLGDVARMGVVIQELVDADAAGVMFTRNPLTGACERVIEASWGLGETVVSGTVTPDSYVVGTDGCVRAVTTGEKDVAIRCTDRGVVEHEVSGPRVYERCLTDADLIALHELAIACDDVFGCSDHDIEFAFRGGALYLLQRRPITHA